MRLFVTLLAALAFASPAGGRAAAAAARLAGDAADRPRRLARAARPRSDASAPFGFRYQYLAGGVNTGQRLGDLEPERHLRVDVRPGVVGARRDPGAHLLPAAAVEARDAGTRRTADLAHLRDPALMQAYWTDVTLLFQRVHGTKPVVVHVEPDLWGYLEQANAVALGSAFAQQWVSLRDQLAPNVILAYHMSGWGTKHDIVYEKPSDATVRAYATESARFYRALRREVRHLLRGLLRSRRGLLREDAGEREDVVRACRLPPPPAVRRDVRAARRASGWSRGRSRSGTR